MSGQIVGGEREMPRQRRRLIPLVAILISVIVIGVRAGSASAQQAWWHINAEVIPTNLVPGEKGELVLTATNLGDGIVNGSKEPVTITDELPAGLTAVGISAPSTKNASVTCTLATLQCIYPGILNPYEQLAVTIEVEAAQNAGGRHSVNDEVSVHGGEARSATSVQPISVNGSPTQFGVQTYELEPFNEDGTPATQAGAHPFELTTSLVLNQTLQNTGHQPVELPKNVRLSLPAGFLGDPTAVTQCSMADFFAVKPLSEVDLCPPNSAIGVATVTINEPVNLHLVTLTVPVFNLAPSEGEPARFGFDPAGLVPVVIDTSVRSGKDYGVVATVENTSQIAGLLSSHVTLWGVPGDPRHNNARGWECVGGEAHAKQVGRPCPAASTQGETPFLDLPTACAGDPTIEPVMSSAEAASWTQPNRYLGAEYAWMNSGGEPLAFQDCGGLPFTPTIDVAPEQHGAATPTGVNISVKVPQSTTLEVGGLAEADVRDTTVTLPAGVELSPSAANGLEACTEIQVGYTDTNPSSQTQEFNTSPAACPNGSKLGTVKIRTPLLTHELEGSLYLASPAPTGETGQNPFNSLVAVYLVAEDPVSGVLVKLAGEGILNEADLRVATVFRNAPQVPFEELSLHLYGGERASLSTPVTCGDFATEASFTSWASSEPANVLAPTGDFDISSPAPGQASCPSSGPQEAFAPAIAAYGQNTQAGAFTPFTLELTRPDGQQALSGLTVHLPQGVAALLSQTEPCQEAQANTDTCSPDSEIGAATAIAGLGNEPYTQQGGKVFITGPYDGAPFGLEIVTPADAGPFHLGNVTVRSTITVNPNDASITITTPNLPTQVRGIPLQLKRVIVNIDRPNFEFNPTSCNPKTIQSAIKGDQGASANVSAGFHVGGCEHLPFAPTLAASAPGHGSKANGTTFKVMVTSGGTNASGVAQAGIAKVNLQLPKQLSSRLPTLQKACSEAAFNANPATCDEGSVIGYATIHTPVLKNPLSGPAYLVSHGNAAFPDVEFVLQGEGIKLVLDGKTQIKGGITYSKFESTPDAPFTTFETILPAGPHGVLTPNVPERKHFDLCGENLEMPTTIVGQNGAVIERTTRIAIEGCGAVKSAKARKLTLMQKLESALKSCRHTNKHAKSHRVRCERQAHARYTRLALIACHHHHRHAKNGRRACERAARKRFAAKSARNRDRGARG